MGAKGGDHQKLGLGSTSYLLVEVAKYARINGALCFIAFLIIYEDVLSREMQRLYLLHRHSQVFLSYLTNRLLFYPFPFIQGPLANVNIIQNVH